MKRATAQGRRAMAGAKGRPSISVVVTEFVLSCDLSPPTPQSRICSFSTICRTSRQNGHTDYLCRPPNVRFCSSGLNASSGLVTVRTALNSSGVVVIVYSLALRVPTESPFSRGHIRFFFGSYPRNFYLSGCLFRFRQIIFHL